MLIGTGVVRRRLPGVMIILVPVLSMKATGLDLGIGVEVLL